MSPYYWPDGCMPGSDWPGWYQQGASLVKLIADFHLDRKVAVFWSGWKMVIFIVIINSVKWTILCIYGISIVQSNGMMPEQQQILVWNGTSSWWTDRSNNQPRSVIWTHIKDVFLQRNLNWNCIWRPVNNDRTRISNPLWNEIFNTINGRDRQKSNLCSCTFTN